MVTGDELGKANRAIEPYSHYISGRTYPVIEKSINIG
jgi:hypothetical protein